MLKIAKTGLFICISRVFSVALQTINQKRMTYQEFRQPLVSRYGQRESEAIARYVMEVHYGLTQSQILTGSVEGLSTSELSAIRQRLLDGEPVQYVVGTAEFCGHRFHVEPGVLIPRPETEDLCRLIIDEVAATNHQSPHCSVLDIGTGSGCIACTLAAAMPHAQVTACDISTDALRIAARNAQRIGVPVTFIHADILSTTALQVLSPTLPCWDIIVSNPPYVCQNEQAQMESNVLDYEPSLALFVPDDDPLLFYRAIARYAAHTLKPGGRLYLEVTPLYCADTCQLLAGFGFTRTNVTPDRYGRQRIVTGA